MFQNSAALKRTWLVVVIGAVCVLAGCAAPASQARMYGVSVPRPTREALSPADPNETGSVIVSRDVMQQWSYLYSVINHTEFALCLEGTVAGGKVVVDNFRLARIRAFAKNAVNFEECEGPNYIGMAHNHPDAAGNPRDTLCYFSDTDRSFFARDKRAVVDIVICGAKQFVWTQTKP
jgi:hypothetical protein